MESDKERIFKICEDVLGKARRERWKCQLSEETAKKIEDRRAVKKKLYEERIGTKAKMQAQNTRRTAGK